MFQKWDYFRIFTGKQDDWVNCVPGCLKHDYSSAAIEFLTKFEFVADRSILLRAKPALHSVCRVATELHKGPYQDDAKCICSTAPSRIAQHFIHKITKAEHANPLPLHVFLQGGWANVKIYEYQNKDPTRGQNMSAYSSPQIHKAPSISLSGSQSSAPTFPSTQSTVSELSPTQYQQGIALNQKYHYNFAPNPEIHFQNEIIDTFCSEQGDKKIRTVYKGRNKLRQRLRAHNKC